jgi:beta-galactosidase
MSNVTLTNRQVMIDGEPVLIIAAEFHYFRTPKSAWRERLVLLKNSGFNTIATYIPWLWHEPISRPV